MGLFDRFKESVNRVVNNTMGTVAVWTPSHGGDVKTATVLFKDPTETQKFLGVEFDNETASFEYLKSDFPGLRESANLKNDEIVHINGLSYGVNAVRVLHDGDIYLAEIQRS